MKHTTLNSIISVFNLGSKLLLKHCPLMYSYNHELCSCNSFWLRQFCTMRNWNMVWHVDPKRPSYCLWPQSSVNSNKLPFKLIYSFEFNHEISKTVNHILEYITERSLVNISGLYLVETKNSFVNTLVEWKIISSDSLLAGI